MGTVQPLAARYRERWQLIHEELRKLILRGTIAPGERLREQELADRYGVSRGPVREAFRQLETEGLVIRRAGQATHATDVGAADVDEIFSLRLAVEPLAARRALQNDPVELERSLTKHLDNMKSAIASGDEPRRSTEDIAFHGCFYELAQHQRLALLWRTLHHPLRVLMNVSSTYAEPAAPGVRAHATILDAVQERSLRRCEQAIRSHLTIAQSVLRNHFTPSTADA